MRPVAIVLVVLLAAVAINFLRAGAGFPIVRCLPLCGGHSPGIYDIGAFALLLMVPWGLARLRRNRDDDK